MPRTPRQPDWLALNRLAWESLALAAEAGAVIWLRSLRLAGGGAMAEREAALMVGEKVLAGWELGSWILTGGLVAPEVAARRSVRHYRSKVRANRRRLGV